MRMTVNKGTTAYHPNSLGGGCPFQAMMKEGGFTSFPERVDAHKIRNRSESFSDHFSQTKLFMNSLSEHEKRHMIDAYAFELSKVNYDHVKERVCFNLNMIDKDVAKKVADKLGIDIPKKVDMPLNQNIGADENPKNHQPKDANSVTAKSEKLSMTAHNKGDIKTRMIGIICDNGVDETSLNNYKTALEKKAQTINSLPRKAEK
ncbi:catalase-related domain-containing protein [Chryseobacterium taklimakanense]|uniref:catalase-related domain-containing protein n=1 Tax=Chryseobacterium taklimakanense TaxID=536441 RepID=UPI0037435B17